MGIHEAHIGPQVGRLLPLIPWHLVEEGVFTMHHFVVGQGEDEVFIVVIDHREGHIVVMILAVDRILLHDE